MTAPGRRALESLRPIAVGAAARPTWHRTLATDPNALVSQTPTWLDCACAVGGFEDATRAYRTGDGSHLVLPLARRRVVPPAPGTASSMPFGWGTGGLVSTDGRVSADDVSAIAEDLVDQGYLVATVKPSPATSEAWAGALRRKVVRTEHVTQTLDISSGFDDVWKNRF